MTCVPSCGTLNTYILGGEGGREGSREGGKHGGWEAGRDKEIIFHFME